MKQMWNKPLWAKSEEPYDLFFRNDEGEDYNMSEAVRNMNDKVQRCLERAVDAAYLSE